MLPHYPNNRPHHHHRHCVYQQEQPLLPPNPTAAAFLMPATASWDDCGGQIFPADCMYSQETLEAVLRQPVAAPLQAPSAAPGERELRNGAPVVHGGVRAGAPRKRPLRTDRHSKIRTAQGVRDRRMRLSVGVARDFFALQDRLGFDKASKTVNWLLTQSKPAIDRLCDAAVPAAAFVPAVKKKGEGSSSSAGYFERPTEKARSKAGPDGPVALVEEHGGGELDWIMSQATAAPAIEPPQPMDGLEYYYQYYQLEEMMRCNKGRVPR